jgi:hypothetical protein
MFSARLPDEIEVDSLKNRLYDEYGVEAPILIWNGMKLIRISIQGYNTRTDTNVLLDAFGQLLAHPEMLKST